MPWVLSSGEISELELAVLEAETPLCSDETSVLEDEPLAGIPSVELAVVEAATVLCLGETSELEDELYAGTPSLDSTADASLLVLSTEPVSVAVTGQMVVLIAIVLVT